jgi:tetratricopeptide (TPR) repeat protein
MAQNDRRAQRKAKKRQERIRQQKHLTRYGYGLPSMSDFPPSFFDEPADEPAPIPRMSINVHHVRGGDMIMMERAHRTMDFLLAGREIENMDEIQEILNTHLIGEAYKENHRRMLLSSELERAQDLAFTAIEDSDSLKAVNLAKDALALDPECCDAHLTLATRGTTDKSEQLAILEKALANERKRLGGDTFFAENSGHFWEISSTRPYMRARYAYALTFKALGQYAQAAAECRALIELCEEDRQAVRHQYLACLMAGDLLEELLTAIGDDNEELDAPWLWAKVLERLLAHDPDGADHVLKQARRANFMVVVLLLIPPEERHQSPPRYETGEASEAVYIADVYGCAWDKHPEALAWLQEHA